jgi:response regulator RpfG family c-di-GMP phosphodiesterase
MILENPPHLKNCSPAKVNTRNRNGSLWSGTLLTVKKCCVSYLPHSAYGCSIAATHHERWDGSGYPNGLSGEAIPLCGQICAIADVFDALPQCGPINSIDIDNAFDLIQRSSGTLFDPQIVQAFAVYFPTCCA